MLRASLSAAAERYFTGECDEYARLIDFGCGGMPYRSIFEPYVGQYVGVDLKANDRADFFVSARDSKTRLPDQYADIVLSTQVLEHVNDPMAYLCECCRLLKHDGLLVLSTHGYWIYHPSPTDYWRWTGAGLQKVVESSGFQVVELSGIMGLASTSAQLFQDALMPKIPKPTRQLFTITMQLLVALLDKAHSPREKANNACIFVLIGRKEGGFVKDG